jgi:hypothetical protein
LENVLEELGVAGQDRVIGESEKQVPEVDSEVGQRHRSFFCEIIDDELVEEEAASFLLFFRGTPEL